MKAGLMRPTMGTFGCTQGADRDFASGAVASGQSCKISRSVTSAMSFIAVVRAARHVVRVNATLFACNEPLTGSTRRCMRTMRRCPRAMDVVRVHAALTACIQALSACNVALHVNNKAVHGQRAVAGVAQDVVCVHRALYAYNEALSACNASLLGTTSRCTRQQDSQRVHAIRNASGVTANEDSGADNGSSGVGAHGSRCLRGR